jgi:hypothetical protein
VNPVSTATPAMSSPALSSSRAWFSHEPEGVGRHPMVPDEHAGESFAAHPGARGRSTHGLWADRVGRNRATRQDMSRASPMLTDDRRQLRAADVVRFAPQAPRLAHHRSQIILACGHVDIEAVNAARLRQGSVRDTRRDQGALTGHQGDHLVAEEEPAPPGENKGDLVLAVEVCREPDLVAPERPHLDDAI